VTPLCNLLALPGKTASGNFEPMDTVWEDHHRHHHYYWKLSACNFCTNQMSVSRH